MGVKNKGHIVTNTGPFKETSLISNSALFKQYPASLIRQNKGKAQYNEIIFGAKLPAKKSFFPQKKTRLQIKEEMAENLKFIRYLKTIPSKASQPIIEDIYNSLLTYFDCSKCANCCKMLDISLSRMDVIKLSLGLNVPVKDVKVRYLKKKVGEYNFLASYTFNRKPCPFLEGTLCSCYDYRPEECRQFPHLGDGEYIYSMKAVVNCEICPLISTSFEILKGIFGLK